MSEHLLAIALDPAVRLEILRMSRQGGPTPGEFSNAKLFGRELAERGDAILFPDARRGVTAGLFARLATAVAVLAFLPGGITLFEQHYRAIVAIEEDQHEGERHVR